MIFFVYLLASVGIIIGFLYIRKHLLLIEVICYFLVAAIINQNIMAFFSVALNYLELTKQVSLYWVLVVSRVIFVPMLMVWFAEFYVRLNLFRKKCTLIVLMVVLLSLIHWLNIWLGLMKPNNTEVWWILAKFSFMVLSFLSFVKFFKYAIGKEGRINAP